MRPNIANEFAQLNSQYAVLDVLKKARSARFKELKAGTKLSTRTLTKHLSNLVHQGAIEKWDSRYHITATGLEYQGLLENQLEKFKRYRERLPSSIARRLLKHCAVDVTTIEAFGKGRCLGIFDAYLPGALGLEERQQMDRALTHAMRIIAHAIPRGSREYGVMITGTLK